MLVHSFAYNHNNNDTLQDIVVVVHDSPGCNISSIYYYASSTNRPNLHAAAHEPKRISSLIATHVHIRLPAVSDTGKQCEH